MCVFYKLQTINFEPEYFLYSEYPLCCWYIIKTEHLHTGSEQRLISLLFLFYSNPIPLTEIWQIEPLSTWILQIFYQHVLANAALGLHPRRMRCNYLLMRHKETVRSFRRQRYTVKNNTCWIIKGKLQRYITLNCALNVKTRHSRWMPVLLITW